jgi:hypothetical protein
MCSCGTALFMITAMQRPWPIPIWATYSIEIAMPPLKFYPILEEKKKSCRHPRVFPHSVAWSSCNPTRRVVSCCLFAVLLPSPIEIGMPFKILPHFEGQCEE